MSHHDTTHHDGSHHDVNWDEQIAQLESGGELHTPFFEQAIAWLSELRAPAAVRRVLDIGSGPGVVTCLLADTFTDADVVAVDGAAALLERALQRASLGGLGERVRIQSARLPEDVAGLPEADLIWASYALHHVGDQQDVINQLSARLRPGGLLAVAEGGLATRFLPNEIGFGRPGLQTRVDAAHDEGFGAMRSALPDARVAIDDWPGMLRASGLSAVTSRTFLIDQAAPLPERTRALLREQLVHLRDRLDDRFAADDRAAFDRLLDPAAPDGLMHRPDVFFLVARTVHVGARA